MKKNKLKLNQLLKGMTFGMKYRVLEVGKDDDELENVAKRNSIRLPSKDISVFKGVYGFVDLENLNGCTLPRNEVEQALDTLNHKSVDFDHFRKKIVGHWLEASITDKDEIVAYGIFFKGSLEDEYEELKDLLNEGKLKISFEAWGTKEQTDEDSYNLTDIEFAGGALLLQTEPAFSDARVLEMAKNNNFIHDIKEKITDMTKFQKKLIEMSRFHVYDFETILRLVQEVGNPDDPEQSGYHDILMIDFQKGLVKTEFISFSDTGKATVKKYKISITPRVEKGEKQIRKVLKIEVDNSSLDDKKNDVGGTTKMDEKIKELEQEIAKLKEEAKVQGEKVASLETQIEESKVKLDEKSSELEKVKEEEDAKVSQAKEEATKIAERRSELGEDHSKDLEDADILDDVKFENAKLKKEVAELKSKKSPDGKQRENASTQKESDLQVGTKEIETATTKKAKRVQKFAFPE